MNINAKDNYYGIPMVELRKLVKSLFRWRRIEINNFQSLFNTYHEQSKLVIKMLEIDGFIEKVKYGGAIYFVNTVKGNALAMSSAAKPLKRESANKIVKEFLNRVINVNENDDFLYNVVEVRLFGSILSNKERLSDIDIGIKLKYKYKFKDVDEMDLAHEIRLKKAFEEGRRISGFFEEMTWSSDEVKYYLKSKSGYLSLHPIKDIIALKTESKVIYKCDFKKKQWNS